MGAVAVFTRRLGNVAVLAVRLGVVDIVLARELVDVHVVVVVVVLVAEAGVPELWRFALPWEGSEALSLSWFFSWLFILFTVEFTQTLSDRGPSWLTQF